MTHATQNNIKLLRTDSGEEYVGHELQAWLKRREIVHVVRKTYYPGSNVAAKRLHLTLLDMTRTMLLHVGNPRTKL